MSSEIAHKLRRHASNVKIAANQCDEVLDAADAMEATPGGKEWIDRERMKKNCLEDASAYMMYVAELMTDGRVEEKELPNEIPEQIM